MLLGTDPATKLHPTFFIGLGGSGGRVVDVLARRLAAEPSFARFEDLVHFIVLDTDQNDLQRLHGRILKSNIATAHKPRRIALHRGEAAGTTEDRRVTSWVHPWYRFREHSNAGAGQIRLEARYSLHCQLAEQSPQNVEQLMRKCLGRALRAQLPNRGSERVRVHLFASTAGGTGSGASLVMAYLARKLSAELGAECEVFGHFFLPSLFRDKVAPPLVPKIDANGYAALKEIERAQELRYEGGPEALELVFHPGASFGKTLSQSEDAAKSAAFDWVYLLDKPEAMTIEEIYAAAGEAAYLQMFTPILGYQEREADNFRQLQTRLAAGYFALQNGSIGASVIELPRRRLVRYFARKWSIQALRRFVVAGSDSDTKLTPEEMATLSDTEQGRRLDAAFAAFVNAEARTEEQAKKPGIFSEIAKFESQNTQVLTAFRKALEVELQAAEDAVQIDSINAAALTPENYSLNAARDAMARDFQRSRQALATMGQTLERDFASGQWLGRFFETHRISPLLQRHLLIEIDKLAREELRADLGPDEQDALVDWVLSPYDEVEAGRHLALRPADPATYRVDTPEIRKQIESFEAGLGDAARKVFRKDQAFTERRQVAVAFFNQLRDAARDALVVELWQRVMRALQAQVQQRLEVFRVIARQGLALVAHLTADAERCRAQGLEVPDIGQKSGETNEFHLGSEVFHDERRGVRCWDQVWDSVLGPGFQVPTAEVLAIVNAHLQTSSTADAKKAGALDQILGLIAKDIDTLGRERVQKLIDHDRPLSLADGLVLEAQLAALNHQKVDEDRLRAVPAAAITEYLREKLQRVAGMSRALGRFDEPVLAGKEFSPYRPRFYGIAPELLRQHPVLGDALAMGAPGFERLEDWSSPDIVSFYQATLGIPLYAWNEVQGQLARAYEHQSADPMRHEPLHIDHRWEDEGFHDAPGPGLPGLDPVRRRAWEDQQHTRRDAALGAFAATFAAGLVRRVNDRWQWVYRQKTGDLGGSLDHALIAWGGLSDALRGPLADATTAALTAAPHRAREAAQLAAGWRFDAEADGKVSEARALGRLVAALTAEEREAA